MKHLKTVIFSCILLFFSKNWVKAQTIRVTPDRFAGIISDSVIQKLDVRTGIEYDVIGHIPGFTQINSTRKNFEKKVMQKLDPNKPVAVYCMSGHRSVDACKKLEHLGFKTIYELDGGIIQWVAGGGKLE